MPDETASHTVAMDTYRVDPRVAGLRAAVARLSREMALHPVPASDREVAEDELAALDIQAATGALVTERLRRSLLLVHGALGSISALRAPLGDLRHAIDRFGTLPTRG